MGCKPVLFYLLSKLHSQVMLSVWRRQGAVWDAGPVRFYLLGKLHAKAMLSMKQR